MAANNQKPPRHKNSNYVVFRKSLFEPKKKLKSDLFNYSCVHLVFILFKNSMISVALISKRHNNPWNMVPNNSRKIHVVVSSNKPNIIHV